MVQTDRPRKAADRRDRDNLTKRCDCSPRKQLTCSHPWHIDFYRGRKFRYSLDVLARARGIALPRTKTDAETLRDLLRSEIRAGTFKDPSAKPDPIPTSTRLTFDDVAGFYLKRHVHTPTRRDQAAYKMACHVEALKRALIPAAHAETIRLGEKPFDDITKADIEAIRDGQRRAAQVAKAARDKWETEAAERAKHGKEMETPRPRLVGGEKGGEVGINRLLARLRHLFSWAIAEGYTQHTPFKRSGQTVVRLTSAVETPRHRRLAPGETERLLAACSSHLRAVVEAALWTGCRRGELLSLTWAEVRYEPDAKGELQPRYLTLKASKTKTNRTRVVPVSQRLAAILAMRRTAADGKPFAQTAFVFGNEAGEEVKSIKSAWRGACRRASLVDLEFRDLRREFGSSLLESRASLHVVRDFLGHANITTTSRYLATTSLQREQALRELEQQQAAKTREVSTAAEKDCHTEPACDNAALAQSTSADAVEVLKQ